MNRSLLEGDPHSMLEGLTIAGYAVGAKRGFVYVRAEYPLAVERVQKAIQASRERGLLGNEYFPEEASILILKSVWELVLLCAAKRLHSCNPSKANAGCLDQRPPFPAEKGLWGQPTTINNVETLAWVPLIIRHGWEWFSCNWN